MPALGKHTHTNIGHASKLAVAIWVINQALQFYSILKSGCLLFELNSNLKILKWTRIPMCDMTFDEGSVLAIKVVPPCPQNPTRVKNHLN